MENEKHVTLFHGTLASCAEKILREGLVASSGWGGAGTHGVYLSGSLDGAFYWAKLAYLRERGEKLEAARFNSKYSYDNIKVIVVKIPEKAFDKLRADMEQSEDYCFNGSEMDWEDSLEKIGDVMFAGNIPSDWLYPLNRAL